MKKWLYAFALILMLILVGCNLPAGGQATPSSPEAAFTQAAETVAAELTRVALLASPTSNVPTEEMTPTPTITSTPTPTNTPVYTPTYTPIPCNLAYFVNDITYKDNTVVAPGLDFTKIWRLRNVGTCTWTSAYKVAFDHGNGMGVPAGYTQSLTGGTVPPGQNVDISVNLSAPTTNGTYRGDWSLRDPNNRVITTFIVVIKVVTSTTVTLTPVADLSGAVDSDSTVSPNILKVGDTATNSARELFLSYDISDIPSNATITEVKTSFNTYTHGGNPFDTLGVLNGYVQDYGTKLDASDYVHGFPGGNKVDWGSLAALNNVEASPELKTALQAKLSAGRFQMRLQFAGPSSNGTADFIQFTHPSLIITYTVP
jgi:hypothetical protein